MSRARAPALLSTIFSPHCTLASTGAIITCLFTDTKKRRQTRIITDNGIVHTQKKKSTNFTGHTTQQKLLSVRDLREDTRWRYNHLNLV